MAYYRTSLIQTHQNSPTNRSNIAAMNFDVDLKEKKLDENSKPNIIFSIDISHWSPVLQYLCLAAGLIFFMCLYGYYQELVQYGWFEQRLSLFSTFLHFLFVSFFAQMQRSMSKNNSGSHGLLGGLFTMGTAPSRTAVFYYVVLVLGKTIAQGMSNLSMTQINYPAKVLFKSANPILTMLIGVFWFRRSYPLRDYFVVFLLVIGLYIFITGDSTVSPQSTGLGILYVVISMFGSVGVPMIQEHCIVTYNASVEDLLYHSFLGSTLVSFVLSLFTGELFTGISFLWTHSSLSMWYIFIAFCTFGFCGANFSTALTSQYGALVNGITNTFRKAVTLALSFLLFPERNKLTSQKLFGAGIFFCGLLVRIFSKQSANPMMIKKTYSGNSMSPRHVINSNSNNNNDTENKMENGTISINNNNDNNSGNRGTNINMTSFVNVYGNTANIHHSLSATSIIEETENTGYILNDLEGDVVVSNQTHHNINNNGYTNRYHGNNNSNSNSGHTDGDIEIGSGQAIDSPSYNKN